ncbi:hypothetical protein M433DRAFT_152103 [Acidomyces richmondensis BFW]|jgi:nicotinamidase-related amidase|nr:MAG: hypothetical protein FE78DRAFT_86739 [Acidomyces sp. 'richmondensis']KYG47547.1 hypothetical protein M433DRAFT_152103 [Acidomyces richmondensis BFW]
MKFALVIIDMQRFFGNMSTAPLANIRKLHAFFIAWRDLVILTQHWHTEDLRPPLKNQLVKKLGPENVLKTGSREWELIPDIWKMAKVGVSAE